MGEELLTRTCDSDVGLDVELRLMTRYFTDAQARKCPDQRDGRVLQTSVQRECRLS